MPDLKYRICSTFGCLCGKPEIYSWVPLTYYKPVAGVKRNAPGTDA